MGTAPAPVALTSPPPEELLGLALRLARDAAAVLRERPPDLGVAATKTSPTDVVTVMDKAAERVILDGLRAARPGDGIVSEESPPSEGETGVRWLVDPLDGTVNYLYGLPSYAVSIAAEVDGEMAAGVVVDVVARVEYTATRGGGAWRDGSAIRCSDTEDPAHALVGTGFNYTVELRRQQAREVAVVLPAVRDIRRIGSAALDLCAVAAGHLDAHYEAGMQPWDWAAGSLIAREAGARIGGVGGGPPGFHTTLTANPVLFDLLHDVLVAAQASPPR